MPANAATNKDSPIDISTAREPVVVDEDEEAVRRRTAA